MRLEEDIKKVDSELTDIRNKTSEMTSIYQQAESQIKKVKKKKKARELNTQVGFYLMSKEESTYAQHYTPN